MIWIFIVVGLAVGLYFAYLRWFMRWLARETHGLSYFSRPREAREALKQRIRTRSAPVRPFVALLAGANQATAKMPSFEYRGVSGPPGVASPEIFAAAERYVPTAADVFVATQMRCGTTWMQQIVYQVLTRGRGELGQAGLEHLYKLSPWIDATTAVPMDAAPLVGTPPSRIVKTHLPADLMPYSADAKYVYVTRHPVTCFDSIVDYNRSLLGPFTPPLETLAAWYCSEKMYWRPWPEHVAGWWDWSVRYPNVLFIHYEDLVRDFPGQLSRIEQLLGVALTDAERRDVVEKTTFKYMKANEPLFEMAPPTMFSVNGGEYLKKGTGRKKEDVTPEIRGQIIDFCRRSLQGRSYPAARFYADLTPGQP